MGFINESKDKALPGILTSWQGNGSSGHRNLPIYPSPSKSQYGYRSGPLGKQEEFAIWQLDRYGQASDIVAQLAALEKIERATTAEPLSRSGPWPVNDRDYSVISRPPRTSYGTSIKNNIQFKCRGAVQISSVNPSYFRAAPDFALMRNMAAEIMVSYRPTKPDFNLSRFVGELKDFPLFFAAGNYVPKRVSDAGGSFLNYVFGIKPTSSDIKSACEAVLKGDELIQQFIRDSGRLVQRSAFRELSSESWMHKGNIHSNTQQTYLGGLTVRWDLGAPNSTYAGPDWESYLGYKRYLKVFSTFEYFVGDPENILRRMDSYKSAALKTLDGGFTLSTAYELTPFSWLFDWFYDLGALLAYQQDVADFSLVQRRGGFVVQDEYYGSLTLNDRKAGGWYQTTDDAAVFSHKLQWRRSGTPYNMALSWDDFNPMQWAILAALGLTKADKIPFLRQGWKAKV